MKYLTPSFTWSFFIICSLWNLGSLRAQTDTVSRYTLDSVYIQGENTSNSQRFLDEVNDLIIFQGKKNEVISLAGQNAGLAEKYGRLVFAKIPGIFVYDMDGTGNQVNISTRGLDPHRGWEFNIRKDGVITNTDMYGYPASHYNIPMEAVDRIELIRGSSAQQYGGQFGGMLNYVSKSADPRKLGFESVNTVGSFGLLSTFNRISGTLGKWEYSAWVNKKYSNGYRDYSRSTYDGEAFSLKYNASPGLNMEIELAHSDFNIQLAGPITDAQFKEDPTQASRSRNYYEPDIYIPSFTLNWTLNPTTKLKFISSAILGTRSSVMFDYPATIRDSIVTSTGEYNHRKVDEDLYHSFNNEVRLNKDYKFGDQINNLNVGALWINNDLNRRQMGKGTTGTDYDLTLVTPGWGRDLHFKTNNIAFFAENKWSLTDRFSVNTAARIELGQTNLTGVVRDYETDGIPNTIDHKFPTFGLSFQYDFQESNLYGGWSQAYRPVLLMDIIPGSQYEKVDKDLRDATGYNAELGYRGQMEFLKWDFTLFYLSYNDRMGSIAQYDGQNNYYVYKTNIGDSHNKGAELFLEGIFPVSNSGTFSVFTSSAFNIAKYKDAEIRVGDENVRIDGNYVESTPKIISRNGVMLKYERFEVGAQYSYMAESFADALNAREPDVNGATGLVPAYSLVDLNFKINFSRKFSLIANANNVFDKQYFTKRPQFYPGPGVWPSDGRSFSLTWRVQL